MDNQQNRNEDDIVAEILGGRNITKEDLGLVYKNARNVCDPIEFQARQRDLLYAVCDYLLNPIKDPYEKE